MPPRSCRAAREKRGAKAEGRRGGDGRGNKRSRAGETGTRRRWWTQMDRGTRRVDGSTGRTILANNKRRDGRSEGNE